MSMLYCDYTQGSSDNIIEENEPEEAPVSYALKVISRQRQVGFVVENFNGDVFKTKEEIQDKICTLRTKHYITESDEIQFGYNLGMVSKGNNMP